MRTIRAEQIEQDLARTATRLASQSLEPAMQAMLPPLRQGFQENFQRTQSSTGEMWPDRKEEGDGHPLLQDPKDPYDLYGAMQGGTGKIEEVAEREMTVGVDSESQRNAGVHNFGYDGPGFGGTRQIHIPAREYCYASDETMDRMLDVLADKALDTIFG